ncbi:MAG: hypothetical protein LUC25_06250 [Ruminococcus sp.]|nr:hypothetical protein [Ruminococcus sp.]
MEEDSKELSVAHDSQQTQPNKMAMMPMNKLLLTMSVPLMLSLLVQSLYNIVDSIFVSRYSEQALTATSLVYSVQFLMIAFGVGTNVGLNSLLARYVGAKKTTTLVGLQQQVFL